MFWRVRVSAYFGEFCRVLHPDFGLSTTFLLRGREVGARGMWVVGGGGGYGDCLGGGGISARGGMDCGRVVGVWGVWGGNRFLGRFLGRVRVFR